MSSLLSAAATFFSGAWLYIVATVIVAGGGAYGGYELKAYFDAPVLQQAKDQVDAATAGEATAEKAVSDAKAIDAQNQASADAKALASQTSLQSEIATLQTQYATSEKARVQASQDFQKALLNAPKQQTSQLGPAVLDYLDRLRVEQSAGSPPDHPAPAANPNGLPVPANSGG